MLSLYHNITIVAASVLLIFLFTSSTSSFHPYSHVLLQACLSAFFGVTLWVTFFSGVLLFKLLEKPEFGRVQASIFPVYFAFDLITVSLAIACLVAIEFKDSPPSGDNLLPFATSSRVASLIIAFAACLLQLFAFGPLTTKVMMKRQELEKEEGYPKEKTKRSLALRKADKR